MDSSNMDRIPETDDAVQGEGDYISARKYQQAQHDFAAKEKLVEEKAREAADALDGPEADELEEAEEVSREGNSL